MDINDEEIFNFFQIPKSKFSLNDEWEDELSYTYYESKTFGLSILYVNKQLNSVFFFVLRNDEFNETNLSVFNCLTLKEGVMEIENKNLYSKKEILNAGNNINYFIGDIQINVTLNNSSAMEVISVSLASKP